MEVDDLLLHFGDPGKYQIMLFIMLVYSKFSMSFNNLMNFFLIIRFPHHCRVSEDALQSESIPRTETGEFESCLMYVNASDHSLGTTSCNNGWDHFSPDGQWTIVQEWDLVCEYHYLPALATTLYFTGVMIGSLLFGYLTDRYGRKPVMLTCLYANVIVSMACALSNSFTMYVVTRFLCGCLVQGTYGAAYVMSMEIFQPRLRSLIAICIQELWPCSMLMVTLLSYLLKSWKMLIFVCNIPFVLTLVYIWFMPECPRWLIAVGNATRAKTELERFAKFNKLDSLPDLESDIRQIIAEKAEKNYAQTYGIKDLFKRTRMKLITLISCYFYFAGVFAFYAISFSITALGINLHLTNAVGGGIEVIIVFCMYFLMRRIGRRTLAQFWLSVISIVCFVVVILEIFLPPKSSSITIVAVIGRASLAAYFSATNVYISELSPTVIRTLVSGMVNFVGRIGGILAPQVLLMDNLWKPLPFLLCGILTFISVFLTVLLPETRDKPLPEVPRDVNKLWKDVERARTGSTVSRGNRRRESSIREELKILKKQKLLEAK